MTRVGRLRSVMVVLLAAAAVLRCSSFGDGTDSTAPDASTAEDTSTPPDAPTPLDASTPRTGVACATPDMHCAVGEKCCGVYGEAGICATSCSTVDATFYEWECGEQSDCNPGQECCFGVNGDCNNGFATNSKCVPKGNCSLCNGDAGGNSFIGCNPASNADCDKGKRCTHALRNTFYTGCMP